MKRFKSLVVSTLLLCFLSCMNVSAKVILDAGVLSLEQENFSIYSTQAMKYVPMTAQYYEVGVPSPMSGSSVASVLGCPSQTVRPYPYVDSVSEIYQYQPSGSWVRSIMRERTYPALARSEFYDTGYYLYSSGYVYRFPEAGLYTTGVTPVNFAEYPFYGLDGYRKYGHIDYLMSPRTYLLPYQLLTPGYDTSMFPDAVTMEYSTATGGDLHHIYTTQGSAVSETGFVWYNTETQEYYAPNLSGFHYDGNRNYIISQPEYRTAHTKHNTVKYARNITHTNNVSQWSLTQCMFTGDSYYPTLNFGNVETVIDGATSL